MTDPSKSVDSTPAVTRPDSSLSQPTPAQRVTSVLLNGKNFHAWSTSLRLFLGGKRKSLWLLGKMAQPAETDPKYDE